MFLANPKTASTSVRKILDEYSDHKILENKGMYHEHWTARQYKRIFENLGYDWENFYKFINIRNPWDKYVSNFHFSKPDSNFKPFYNKEYDRKSVGLVSFNEWVKFHLAELKKPPQGCYRIDRFAGDGDGNIIVDDVFPIENFSVNTLPGLLKCLNLKRDIELPILNTTKRDGYRDYYDEQSKKLVAQYCFLDIEYGQYKF